MHIVHRSRIRVLGSACYPARASTAAAFTTRHGYNKRSCLLRIRAVAIPNLDDSLSIRAVEIPQLDDSLSKLPNCTRSWYGTIPLSGLVQLPQVNMSYLKINN
jgi:hypothetical protein